MATAFDNTKHDIQLNDVPYRIRGYQRSELSTFIPRLGSGEQSESEFDLLRSASIKGFTGGELQRFWNDDTSIYGAEGLENRYDDGVLYPNQGFESDNGEIYGATKPRVLCSVNSGDYLFVAYTTYASPTRTYITRYDKSGTATGLTLPTALNTNLVTSMVIKSNQLWIFSANYSSAIFYMSLSSTTVNSVTGGSGWISQAVVFKGEIYGTDSQNQNTFIVRYTGDTTTRSFENVGIASWKDADSTANFFVYNNRIILTRKDGMYGYDGIQLTSIESLTGAENDKNYYLPIVLKGYLYYFMPDGLYRFNGSLIEKLYDKSEIGYPVSVTYGQNKIYYLFDNSDFSGVSRYDKSMGYDYESTDFLEGRVVEFDGQAMYTYGRTQKIDKGTITEDFSGQGRVDKVIYFNEKLYVTTYMTKTFDNLHVTPATPVTTRSIILTSSIFNAGFSQIDKQLENIELEFDGDVTNQTFTLEYRIADFEGDSGWASLGTLTSSTSTKLNVYDLIPSGVVFRDIQFRITATMSVDYGIKTFIVRYILVPDYKTQWTFTALCYGDSSLAPSMLQDTTEDTQDVGDLRGNIYSSRESDIPIGYLDIDYLVLNEELDNSETTIDVVSTSILKSNTGFIQIGTEIMKYTAKTSTTLTVERGVLGSSATTHTTGEAIYIYYRTIIRTIQNERIELTDEESTSINRTRDSEITIVLQEV